MAVLPSGGGYLGREFLFSGVKIRGIYRKRIVLYCIHR